MYKLIYYIFILFASYSSATYINPFIKYNSPRNDYKNISRIVVIADIHDDLFRFKKILQTAKIIDKHDSWIADKTLVVQLGDQIDSKDNNDNKHHFRMIKYTEYLKNKANTKDSDFVSLIGNHELMNIDKIKKHEILQHIISKRPIVFIVNNYLFCHGGFHTEHLNMLSNYGKSIKDLNEIWRKYVKDIHLSIDEIKLLDYLILDTQNSILYNRKNLNDHEVFEYLDIEYSFVGHTITNDIYLHNRVWHLDQYLHKAFDDKKYNYLDIVDGKIIIRSIDY